MLLRLLLLVLGLLATGLGYRQLALGDWGWTRVHSPEFAPEGCEVYQAMLGLNQDPSADPANAELVARCKDQVEPVIWVLSQVGDALRFDRPSRVRLRVDVIDMAPEYQETYPTMVIEFPYPPVPMAADARWRVWGGLQTGLSPAQAQQLERYWNPSWAGLFANWTLGRGNHEVWLGRAGIFKPEYCAAVERDPKDGEQLCVMHLYNHKGDPVTHRFPLQRKMEWRFEVLDICRFGGRVRRWDNPLTRSWFGPVEYADPGCEPFVTRDSQGH